MPTEIRFVALQASARLMPALAEFYGERLGLPVSGADPASLSVCVGETRLELHPGAGEPFYHVALLVPGGRFEAALDWAGRRVELLTDPDTGDAVFEFENWDAQACYFHDPAGNILELIAHHGVGEAGTAGPFDGTELIGVSEIGLVGDPPALADALAHVLGLEVWSGTATEAGRLAFVGEKARTLILASAGRPWFPTGRSAEAHPVEVVLAGAPEGEVPLDGGGSVRRCASRDGTVASVRAS